MHNRPVEREDTSEVKCIRNHIHFFLISQCLKQYNLHSHITDDVLGQRRFQERLQNLETMEQGVWLVEMICTAVPTDVYERFVRDHKIQYHQFTHFQHWILVGLYYMNVNIPIIHMSLFSIVQMHHIFVDISTAYEWQYYQISSSGPSLYLAPFSLATSIPVLENKVDINEARSL